MRNQTLSSPSTPIPANHVQQVTRWTQPSLQVLSKQQRRPQADPDDDCSHSRSCTPLPPSHKKTNADVTEQSDLLQQKEISRPMEAALATGVHHTTSKTNNTLSENSAPSGTSISSASDSSSADSVSSDAGTVSPSSSLSSLTLGSATAAASKRQLRSQKTSICYNGTSISSSDKSYNRLTQDAVADSARIRNNLMVKLGVVDRDRPHHVGKQESKLSPTLQQQHHHYKQQQQQHLQHQLPYQQIKQRQPSRGSILGNVTVTKVPLKDPDRDTIERRQSNGQSNQSNSSSSGRLSYLLNSWASLWSQNQPPSSLPSSMTKSISTNQFNKQRSGKENRETSSERDEPEGAVDCTTTTTTATTTITTGSSPISSDNDECAAAATATPESMPAATSPTRKSKRLSFNEQVLVCPIPKRDEYSSRIKRYLWSTPQEMMTNAHRNHIEFASEGWDWRKSVEDDTMFRDINTNELIHPIHVVTMLEEQQDQQGEDIENQTSSGSLMVESVTNHNNDEIEHRQPQQTLV